MTEKPYSTIIRDDGKPMHMCNFCPVGFEDENAIQMHVKRRHK